MALTRTAMRNRIKAITAGFRESAPSIKEPSEKAKQIIKLCNSRNLDYNHLVIEFSEILLQEKISSFIDNGNNRKIKYHKPLVCVVIIDSQTNHGYPLNIPVVIVGPIVGNVVLSNGMLGNSTVFAGEMRLATDEEIDQLTDAQLDYLIKEYTA